MTMCLSENISAPSYDMIDRIRHAAGCGYVRAQLQMGRYYLSVSHHDDVDKEEATFWLKLAALQGNSEASTLLTIIGE